MAKPEFEEIVARYDRRLFNVMYGMTGDYHEALDITEDAFVRAMKAWPRFRGDSDPFTWLYRIAVNVLKRRYRKTARRRELLSEHFESDPPLASQPSSADSDVLREERATLVRRAISELPSVFREAITLRYVDEMSYEDIADTVGCSMGTVKSRIARGKSLLADLLEGKV